MLEDFNILFILIHSVLLKMFRNISKKIISEIAGVSITEKIYPSNMQLKAIAARYLNEEHPEFFGSWDDKKWSLYYDDNIKTEVNHIILSKYFEIF